MKPIQHWISNSIELSPVRVVATIEAQCNLHCLHCYWAHDLPFKSIDDWRPSAQKIAELNIPLLYAGRLLTKHGGKFLNACIESGVKKIGIIDNGYTILNYPSFLPLYEHINISIDGWKEAHDTLRQKEGGFDKAWNTVLELKKQGLDPCISSAFSPFSFKDWDRFEDLLAEHDVPLSSTLVWALPEPSKRGTGIFTDDTELLRAFEKLLSGVPKIINIYALEHVRALQSILKGLDWKPDLEEGDCLTAEVNDVIIVYRPASLVPTTEIALHWDGVFYTPPTYGKKYQIGEVPQEFLKLISELNRKELEVWSTINMRS